MNFKQLATKDNPLVKPTQYSINYINNNYLISENGVLYIDTLTSLLNINLSFSSYTYDLINNFATIVPIIKALKKAI
jgi:hypothetical protein